MRVLQVAHGFPPRSLGGVEYHVSQLCDALRAHGVQSDVFCRVPDPSRSDYATAEEQIGDKNVMFMVVNNSGWGEVAGSRYCNAQIARLFEEFVIRRKPAVVHFHHLIALSANLPELAARRGIPVVMTLHDYWLACPRIQLLRPHGEVCAGPEEGEACASCDSCEDVAGAASGVARRVYRQLPAWLRPATRRLYYRFLRRRWGWRPPPLVDEDRVAEYRRRFQYMRAQFHHLSWAIAPSQALANFYASQGFDGMKLRVVSHGLAPLAYWPASRRPGSRLRVAFIGSLMAHKGVHIFVDALEKLGRERVEAVLYGQRPDFAYSRELDRRLSQPGLQHVRWLGAYQTNNLPAIFAAVDVLVVPSIWPEAFSLVTREAFQAGVPVIGSNLGGLSEAIAPERNGLFVPAGDSIALHAAISRLMDEPGLLERLRKGARATKVVEMTEYAGRIATMYSETQGRIASCG